MRKSFVFRFFARRAKNEKQKEDKVPRYIAHLLDDAAALAKQGKIADALAGYADAQRRSPEYVIDASYWNKLCRFGALWDSVKDVQDACGRAVALEPDNGGYRDSRRISRALVGDSTGAIEDFQAYILWAKQQYADKYYASALLPTDYRLY